MFKSKWEKWYDKQNPTTQVWLDNQAKETNQFALAIGIPAFFIGVVFGILVGIGI
jgi:hypothetical protein